MGLFSFFRKDKQQSSVGNSDFYSQADEEKPAARKRRQGTKRDEPVDPVLPEKKRARRRLVGAIALVLAAIIGLPMILDSEPKPLSSDIAIQIPSKDTPVPSVAPLPAPKPSAAEKAAESAANTLSQNEEVIEPAPTAAATPTAPVKPPVITPSATPSPAATATTSTPHDAAKKPHVDAAKTDTADAKTTQAAAAKKADDAARARAILEGKPLADASAAKSTSKVSLQVAALATQEKVNELQKKLQGAGLKSYTQKVATESGDRIRVRVGPFANDAEAEKARAKLGKLGLTGKLVPA